MCISVKDRHSIKQAGHLKNLFIQLKVGGRSFIRGKIKYVTKYLE